jgi:2,3-bisphosphoglycerate-independent phosphoglycerate mutase
VAKSNSERTTMDPVSPVMLIILDGWGIRTMEHGNAPFHANTPNVDRWNATLERSVLDASGEAVGLVPEQMGNSEVGHLNLGAGRIVYQDITRINIAIRENQLRENKAMVSAFESADSGGDLHLIGLLSDGGVHSHIDHLIALLDITKDRGINPVIHFITDGRDTPTQSGIDFVKQIEQYITDNDHGRIATLSGRYYAMDRDQRWERTGKAYATLTQREGERYASASEGLQASYDGDVTDEFVVPFVVGDDDSLAIKDGDTILCFNFRSDRMRQLARLFTGEKPDGFEGDIIPNLTVTTMTEYIEGLPVEIAFPPQYIKNTLAETISKAGMTQYHTAETEKYPHVTFFFNGREEQPFDGEDRQIIPSPKVATYDLQPEMSAPELTEATLRRLEAHDDAFLLVNFANPDMVGHTGSLEAAIKACETVDNCAGQLVEAVTARGGTVLVTADHGNCDRMFDEITGEPHTYHTTQPVGLFAISENNFYDLRPRGILADVAPTVLHLLGIEQPEDMTGVSLVARSRDS